MKLLIDDKQHRGHNLNANEACIFAAILKCTRAGRGWYGNYRELAAAMPFVMSRQTASRAVDKLLTLGLIEVRENGTLFAVQNGHEDVQNGRDNDQNGREDVQNVLPPNNPPNIDNNMNENQLSSPAQDARTEEKKTEEKLDFMDFWFLFSAPEEMLNRENACRRLWEGQNFSRAKKLAIMKELNDHQMDGTLTEERNPFFYLNNFPEPQPVWKTGGEKDEDLVQVLYNGTYKICTRDTMELFGLQWVRDW
jgi:hypothetical protein